MIFIVHSDSVPDCISTLFITNNYVYDRALDWRFLKTSVKLMLYWNFGSVGQINMG